MVKNHAASLVYRIVYPDIVLRTGIIRIVSENLLKIDFGWFSWRRVVEADVQGSGERCGHDQESSRDF